MQRVHDLAIDTGQYCENLVGLHYQVFPHQGISIVKSPKVEELSVLEELLTEKVLFTLAIAVGSRLIAFVSI